MLPVHLFPGSIRAANTETCVHAGINLFKFLLVHDLRAHKEILAIVARFKVNNLANGYHLPVVHGADIALTLSPGGLDDLLGPLEKVWLAVFVVHYLARIVRGFAGDNAPYLPQFGVYLRELCEFQKFISHDYAPASACTNSSAA